MESNNRSKIRTGWSQNSSHYSDLVEARDFLAKKWRTGAFSPSVINSTPAAPGLYIFHANPMLETDSILSSFSSPFYVGISEVNLKKRLHKHYNRETFGNLIDIFKQNLSISYFTCDYDEINNLGYWEDLIIDSFGPPLNKIKSGKNRVSTAS